MTARHALLDGLARDADIFEVLNGLAPLHLRNDTFPGEVFLHLAADALEWCGARRAEPLALEGLRERHLSECAFRGRQNAKLQYAVLAAAAVRGGTEPDLLEELADWQADDLWQYAMYAAVAYIRAAASRAGVSVRQACQDLSERSGHQAPPCPIWARRSTIPPPEIVRGSTEGPVIETRSSSPAPSWTSTRWGDSSRPELTEMTSGFVRGTGNGIPSPGLPPSTTAPCSIRTGTDRPVNARNAASNSIETLLASIS